MRCARPQEQAADLPAFTADILARVRTRAPRVHCITNTVAQTFTANMLLAAGAVPSMTVAPDEIAAFVARADGLLVNLGTFDSERRAAIDIAVAAAASTRALGARSGFHRPLTGARRLRQDAGRRRRHGRCGSMRPSSRALAQLEPERRRARRVMRATHHAVVGLTGAADFVTDGGRHARISNGHPLMGRVTAMGCAASALVAACLAVEPDAWLATAAGLIALGVAGEIAAGRARGPGSLAVEIIDALHSLDRAVLRERGRVV